VKQAGAGIIGRYQLSLPYPGPLAPAQVTRLALFPFECR
jgi:hypothetical protein